MFEMRQNLSSFLLHLHTVVCGGPRRPDVSSLGINEHTRRACDAPVNSRRPRVSGGRGSHVEQSAGRCHFVTIAVDIQETAEDRTVCSELSIAPPRLTSAQGPRGRSSSPKGTRKGVESLGRGSEPPFHQLGL